MAYDDTSLNQEINAIIRNGANPVHYEWTAVITTPKGDLTPMKVLSIDIHRDYVGNYCDELFLTVTMGLGTYQHQVVPYAANLTAVLKRKPVKEGGQDGDLTSDIEAQSLRATPIKISSAALEGNTTFATDQYSGDLTAFVSVQFQLVDLAIEQARMQSGGTIVKNTTVGDAIKYLITKLSANLKVDVNHKVRGVDMATPNNLQVYQHVIVPHGTKIVDIPGYIAHHFGAPYSAGMGAYLQKSIWYIYPLYDLARFDKSTRSLTVINVPRNRMPRADRSFRRTFNQLIIIATGMVEHNDPSEHLQLTHGNGSRYANARATMEGFVTVKNNKATAQRVTNANEYLAKARPNTLNNVQMSESRITANTFDEMGHLASRLGSLVMVTWENSDPGAIFPGMAAKYVYEVNGQVYELKGAVLKSQTQIAPITPGLFPGPHRSTTVLTLFVERDLTWATDTTTKPLP